MIRSQTEGMRRRERRGEEAQRREHPREHSRVVETADRTATGENLPALRIVVVHEVAEQQLAVIDLQDEVLNARPQVAVIKEGGQGCGAVEAEHPGSDECPRHLVHERRLYRTGEAPGEPISAGIYRGSQAGGCPMRPPCGPLSRCRRSARLKIDLAEADTH